VLQESIAAIDRSRRAGSLTWINGARLCHAHGFPVGYAVSGILLTMFGSFAMIPARRASVSTTKGKVIS